MTDAVAREAGRRRQRGVTLIEAALALGLVAAVIAGFSALLAQSSETTRAGAAGAQLKTVFSAAQSYVKANHEAIQTQSLAGAYALPLSTLTAGGYLPQNFRDTNPYGQAYNLLIQPVPATGSFDVLVATTGGRAIPDRLIAKAASAAEAAGGYVAASNAGVIQGAYGGWRDTTARWAIGGVGPGAGNLAATLSFRNGQIAEFLYRDRVPGHPEANRMETALDLGGNNIENVLVLNAQGANVAGTVTAQTVAAQAFSANAADVTGALTAGSAAIGSDLTAARDVVAGRNVSAGQDLGVARDATVGGTASAGYLVAGFDVTAGRNLAVGQDGTVGRDVTVGRNLAAGGGVTAGSVTAAGDVGAGRNLAAGQDVGAGRSVSAGLDLNAGRFTNARDYYVGALGDYLTNLLGRTVQLSAVPLCSGSNQALQFNGGFTCVAVSGGGGGAGVCPAGDRRIDYFIGATTSAHGTVGFYQAADGVTATFVWAETTDVGLGGGATTSFPSGDGSAQFRCSGGAWTLVSGATSSYWSGPYSASLS